MCKGVISYLPNQTASIEAKTIYILENIVHYNHDHACLKTVANLSTKSASPFTEAWAYEDITIQEFIEYISSSILLDDDCYLFALCLMKNLESHATDFVPLTQRSITRIFFTCLVLGFRFMDDRRFADQEFANLSSLTLEEFRAMQLWVLKVLKFDCFIHAEEFEKMRKTLDEVHEKIPSSTAVLSRPSVLSLSLFVDGLDVSCSQKTSKDKSRQKLRAYQSFVENIKAMGHNRELISHSLSSIFG